MSDGTTSAVKQGIQIRTLADPGEMHVCVDLQQQIWGYSPIDTVPDQVCIVARKTGGQVMAAFDGDAPVGFAGAFMAIRDGSAYTCTHMVGVLDDIRTGNGGCWSTSAKTPSERGINLIEWTFLTG